MWESLHPGYLPWQHDTLDLSDGLDITTAIRQSVLNGQRPRITEKDCPQGYIELMKRCWAKHSDQRPRFLAEFFAEENQKEKDPQLRFTIGSALKKILWEMH
jgi:hypothetical protein